jgi:hypothetical protein
MTDIVVYLATDGVTIQDTNNAIWWACSAAQEMINWIEVSRGFDNLSTGTLYEPIRQDFRVPCPDSSFTLPGNGTKKKQSPGVYPSWRYPPFS